MEHIGDIFTNIAKTTRKVRFEELEFSAEGMEELEEIFKQIIENLALALQAFETFDQQLATKVIKEHPKLLRHEKELRYSHFDRMQGGNEKTIATSAIHLDLLESILRVEGHAVNISQGVLGIV